MNPTQIEHIVRQVLQNMPQTGETPPIKVGVSARHIHLTQHHVETLFGQGHTLTQKAPLMGGQYAANETVTIIGSKLTAIENVRVLGPTRIATQLEISATDAVKLGIKAPLRESGDIHNSAPVSIVGPKGTVYLQEGCIIASRHIHMSPQDAAAFAVTDGDVVAIETPGPRGLVLNHVKIRVAPSFTLEMHIDTDEANASGIKNGDTVTMMDRGNTPCKFAKL